MREDRLEAPERKVASLPPALASIGETAAKLLAAYDQVSLYFMVLNDRCVRARIEKYSSNTSPTHRWQEIRTYSLKGVWVAGE